MSSTALIRATAIRDSKLQNKPAVSSLSSLFLLMSSAIICFGCVATAYQCCVYKRYFVLSFLFSGEIDFTTFLNRSSPKLLLTRDRSFNKLHSAKSSAMLAAPNPRALQQLLTTNVINSNDQNGSSLSYDGFYAPASSSVDSQLGTNSTLNPSPPNSSGSSQQSGQPVQRPLKEDQQSKTSHKQKKNNAHERHYEVQIMQMTINEQEILRPAILLSNVPVETNG